MARKGKARGRAGEKRLHRMRLCIVAALAVVVLGVVGFGLFVSIKPTELRLEEGSTFRTVEGVLVATEGPIKVTEIFSYGCPACAILEPRVQEWVAELPEDVEFEVLPFVGNPAWRVFARGYFAMRDRGLLEANHKRLFEAIGERGMNLATVDRFADFVAEEDPQSFVRAMEGLRVERAMQRADQLLRSLGVVSVPTLVVDGRYVVIGQGASIDALRVAEMLIEKVRRERAEAPGTELPIQEDS